MWTLSGFVDEIDDDFATQCQVAAGLGLKYIEFRSAWGTNVLDLDAGQLASVRQILAGHGLRVSSIGSPIGKIQITDEMGPQLERMRRAVEVADLLQAPYLRLFSFFLPEGDDPDKHRGEVISRMRDIADLAEQGQVVAVHENERKTFGDIPRRCLDIVTSVDSANLKLTWDPANFVQVGVRPFTEGYADLRPHTVYLQIKDAKREDGSVVKAGEGDGQLVETVRALRADGFDGFFSLEPQLRAYNPLGRLTGPDLWSQAHDAFTAILRGEGIEYA